MARLLPFVYRLCCLGLIGAQLFFVAVASQTVFPREVAALPREHPRRALAADLVGAMLVRLDAATIALSAAAVICALGAHSRRAAVLPLLAGLCALASAALITPAIHGMREAGQTALPRFGLLHGLSAGLLLLEIVLLLAAAFLLPESLPPQR
jgi:hypothetical protein